jgi:hypothetical protein
MSSGEDLLILPKDEAELPPSPRGEGESTQLPRSHPSPTFFDDLLRRSPSNKLKTSSAEIPLSYAEVFKADLTTAKDIDRHEALIYQPGFTLRNYAKA